MDKNSKLSIPNVFLSLVALVMVLVGVSRIAAAQEAKEQWPKRFEHPNGVATMYQPQLESFEADKLTARAAVSVKRKDVKEPIFGVVWLSTKVSTDRDTRMATIDEPKITEVKAPGVAPEKLEKFKEFLNSEVKDLTAQISLDRLLAMMEEIKQQQADDQGLKTYPPKIIYANQPAVLVLLQGEPQLRPLEKTKLMRVVNTPFIMIYDPAAKAYFLKGGDVWLTAADMAGPWKDAKNLPEEMKALEERSQKEGKPIQGQKVKAGLDLMPKVIVSTAPAELIVSEGEPSWTPIAGTGLLYLSNTDSNVFMDTAAQQYYALISGRWFAGKSLETGPWAYVAPDKLPADFAKIPEKSAKGFVLSNVAGTQMAKEAVVEAAIPQTAAIDRKKATTQVKYDGQPQFEKVAGTDLEYAKNTGQAVFKEGAKYYVCDQGVWYEANSPNGPWKVSVQPPKDKGKIPPSNPHYNVKYADVYDSNDDVAYVGYTPGYTGTYLQGGTPVLGTGYNYPAYSSDTAYIPYEDTYGYGATYDPYAESYAYTPSYYNPASWLGTAALTAGAVALTGAVANNWWDRYGANYHGPGYWGGGGGYWGTGGYRYNNINNIHNNINNINIRPGQRPDRPWLDRPGAGERPGIGDRPGLGGPKVNPLGSALAGGLAGGAAAGLVGNIYNRPGNNNNLADRRPGKPGEGAGLGKPGAGTLPARPTERPAARPERPATADRPKPATRPAQVQTRPAGANNVFADKDGNVLKRDNKGNWQERQGNQWKPAATPATRPAAATRPASRPERPAVAPRPTPAARPAASTRPSFDSSQLNRDYASRQRGEVRTQQFQQRQSYSRPSGGYSRPAGGGGGGPRGGGGGGRRR
jgi:hypothetical protein